MTEPEREPFKNHNSIMTECLLEEIMLKKKFEKELYSDICSAFRAVLKYESLHLDPMVSDGIKKVYKKFFDEAKREAELKHLYDDSGYPFSSGKKLVKDDYILNLKILLKKLKSDSIEKFFSVMGESK